MQNAEKRGVEKLLVVVGCDAAVVRPQRAAERVGGHVELAAIEIQSDRLGRLASEAVLHVNGKLAVQHRGVRLPAALLDFRHQRNQVFAQPVEHASHVGRQFVRLVIVQQGVVGALRIAQRLGLLAFQLDRPLKQGAKRGKIVFLPGLLPCLLAQNRRPRQFLDQRLRQLHLLVALPLQSPNDYGRVAGGCPLFRRGGCPLFRRARFARVRTRRRRKGDCPPFSPPQTLATTPPVARRISDRPNADGSCRPTGSIGRRDSRPRQAANASARPSRAVQNRRQGGRAAGILADLFINLSGVVRHARFPARLGG